MPKVKLVDTEKVKRWKEIVLGNLHTRFIAGMTEDNFIAAYPNADIDIIKQAVQELISEGKVELV